MMDVRVHTVGHILDGKYKDWYVFVQTFGKQGSYLVLIANNIMFGRDDDGNLIEGREGYDNWIPDRVSLEYHFELNYPQVKWLEGVKLKWQRDHVNS